MNPIYLLDTNIVSELMRANPNQNVSFNQKHVKNFAEFLLQHGMNFFSVYSVCPVEKRRICYSPT